MKHFFIFLADWYFDTLCRIKDLFTVPTLDANDLRPRFWFNTSLFPVVVSSDGLPGPQLKLLKSAGYGPLQAVNVGPFESVFLPHQFIKFDKPGRVVGERDITGEFLFLSKTELEKYKAGGMVWASCEALRDCQKRHKSEKTLLSLNKAPGVSF